MTFPHLDRIARRQRRTLTADVFVGVALTTAALACAARILQAAG